MAHSDSARRAHLPHTRVGAVLIGSLAAFGIIISGAVLALVAAGFMQWRSGIPHYVDEGLPLLLLFGGMLLAGRVAVDVAGSLGIVSAAGAAALVGLLGLMVVRDTAAHGDSIDPAQVGIAALVVLLLVGGTAWVVNWHRRRRLRRGHDPERRTRSTDQADVAGRAPGGS